MNKVKVTVHPENSDGDILTLEEDLEIKFRDKMFIVPAGFKCDGASIPGFLWNKISAPVDPRTLRGAIAHDYLYRNFVPGWDRKEADDLFYQLIREDGLSWLRSQIAYAGVRMFGKGAWSHDEH